MLEDYKLTIMKELSVEQKARRYDNAKYMMKEYLESGNAGVIAENTIKKAFPELSESEGERIRKELIYFLNRHFSVWREDIDKYKSWIAWLEKQNSNVDNANKEYWIGYREGKQEILDKYSELEKQGEQKHTPKHKIGDTIYYNSFGELKSMIVANVTTGGTDNPMYEDENGNAVFEKDLVEQKTHWSKEDERTIKRIDSLLYAVNESEFEDIHNWLKSIKDRYTWKPSEEQIKVLEFFIPYVTKCSIVLEKSKGTLLSLLSDLKKLKG